MRWFWWFVVLAGCGRIGFDPLMRDAVGSGGPDAPTDSGVGLGCSGSRGPIIDLTDPRLVSYWTFNEQMLPAADHGSANAPVMTSIGSPFASPGGLAGELNVFGGSVGATSPAFAPGLGDFTVEAWLDLNIGQCQTPKLLVGFDFGAIGCDAGDVSTFDLLDGNRVVGPVITGGWHHLVGTRRSDHIELWFDGALAVTMQVPVTDVVGIQNFFVSSVGGFIDEIRLWHAALAPDEIARHAHYALPGMLLHLPLDSDFIAPGIRYPAATSGGVATAPGRAGTGQMFNGVDGQIDVAMMPDQNTDFTALVWFRTTDTGGDQTLFHRGPASGAPDQIRMFVNSAGVTGSVRSGDGSEVNPMAVGNFTDNCWHLAAFTRIGADTLMGTIRVYVDGVKGGEQTALIQSTTAPSDPLSIGLRLAGDPRPFGGTLDEVQTYDRALSDAEIATIYTALQ